MIGLRSRFSALIVGAVVGTIAVPSVAHALPNPFVVVLGVEFAVQLLLVLVLTVPATFATLRLAAYRRVPVAAARVAALVLLVATLAAASLSTLPAPDVISVRARSFGERLADCGPIGDAGVLGLPAETHVVDLRPAAAFAAYHLRGSCNLTREELFRSETQRALANVPLALTADEGLDPGNVADDWPAELDARALEGGLQGRYKESGGAFGWGRASGNVVDARGDPVQVQLGPIHYMGSYGSVTGRDSRWRRLDGRLLADLQPKQIVDLRGRECAEGTQCVPAWNARLAAIDVSDEIVPVCDDPPSCLAAEALAWELKERGQEARGYVRSQRVGDALLAPRSVLPIPLAVAALLFAGLAFFLTLAWDRMRRRFATRGGFDAALPAALVAAGLLLPLWVGFPGELASLYFVDALRLGQGLILALLPATVVAAVGLGELRVQRRSRLLRGVAVLASIALLGFEMQSQGEQGLRVASAVLACAALVGSALGTAAPTWLGRYLLRRDGTCLVPLGSVRGAAFAGNKARSLAEVARHGLRVPESFVLRVVPAQARYDAIAEMIQGRFGRRALAVRSTAPDEDAPGALQAGRYHSSVRVTPDGLASAVESVVHSYLEHGCDPEAPVGVLIQPWLVGRLAGVAVGRSARGSVVVEAAKTDNFAITAGEGATFRDALGQISGAFVLGGLRGTSLRASSFNAVLQRLGLLVDGALDVEWSLDRAGVIVLQVRPAPAETAREADRILQSFAERLRWRRARASLTILDRASVGDFPPGATRASEELLRDLLGGEGVRREVKTLLGFLPFAPPPDPAVIRLGGAVYENRVAKRPLRAFLSEPRYRLVRRVLRFRRSSLAQRVGEAITELERAEFSPPVEAADRAEAAAQAMEARRAVLEAAPVAVAAGMLEALGVRSSTGGDPLMEALAEGQSDDEIARRFPDRALPDLALEQPRLGEGRAEARPSVALPKATAESAPETMRGRARVELARRAHRLRGALLALGSQLHAGDRVFDLGVDDWLDGPLPPEEASPLEDPPAQVSVGDLEAWTVLGHPPDASIDPARRGVWIGESRLVHGCVVDAPSGTAPAAETPAAETVPVRLLANPTPEALRSVPEGTFVLASGGSQLCHAALIARERGIAALFSAGPIVTELQPGDRLTIDTAGRVRRETEDG
ncbi:MAG: PEP-utilizing enzyme [Myxococcota bacterium]